MGKLKEKKPAFEYLEQWEALPFKSLDFVLVENRIGVIVANIRVPPFHSWSPRLEGLVESHLQQEILPVEFYGQAPTEMALSLFHAGAGSKQYRGLYPAEQVTVISREDGIKILKDENTGTAFYLGRCAGTHLTGWNSLSLNIQRIRPTGYRIETSE